MEKKYFPVASQRYAGWTTAAFFLQGRATVGMPSSSRSTSPPAPSLGLIAAVYLLTEWFSYQFPDPFDLSSAIWPTSGVLAAALLLLPQRAWGRFVGVLFVANFLLKITLLAKPWDVALTFSFLEVFESTLCALLMRLIVGRKISFAQTGQMAAWILVSISAIAVTSLIAALATQPLWHNNWYACWKTWWIASSLGLVVVTPLMVAFYHPQAQDKTTGEKTTASSLEIAILFTIWLVAAALTFHNRQFPLPIKADPYMLMALLIWPALRLGVRGTAIALIMLAVVSMAAIGLPSGTFPLGGTNEAQHLFWIQVYLAIGSVTGLILAASVEERRGLLRLLRQGEETLNAFSDNLPGTILYQLEYDREGNSRFIYVSHMIESLLGVTAQQLMNNPDLLRSAVLPEDQSELEQAEHKTGRGTPLSHPQIFDHTVRVRRRDGAVRWVHMHSRSRQLPDGRVIWDGAASDVTEQRKATVALHESEELLRTSIHHSPIGHILVATSGHILEVNPAFCQMLGYMRKELQTMKLEQVVHPEDLEECHRSLQKLLNRKLEVHRGEKRLLHFNRRLVWVQVDTCLIWADANTPRYFVLQIQDITRRHLAEAEWQRAVRQSDYSVDQAHH